MVKPKKAWEAELIGKIRSMVEHLYPGIEEQAKEDFIKKNKERFKRYGRKLDFKLDFHANFLLDYELPNGATPVELANSFPMDYFNKKEKKMIKNFLNFRESFFEILLISEDKKDYVIKDLVNSKEYLVKTIDLPSKFKKGDIIETIVVKNLKGDYFFYGAVASYDSSVKKSLIEIAKKLKIKHRLPRKIDLEWKIEK